MKVEDSLVHDYFLFENFQSGQFQAQCLMIMVVGFRVWLGVTFCVDSPLRAATSSREDWIYLTLAATLGLLHDSVLPGADSLSVEIHHLIILGQSFSTDIMVA